MYPYIEYGCATLPEHELVDCGAYPKGGISAVGILESDHTITNFSTASQYEANITSGNLRIIKNIKGNVPETAPVEVDNPVACGADTILAGFNFSAEWQDANVTADNTDMYNALNTRVTYLILFLCGSDEVLVVEQPTNYRARLMVPDNNKALQMFMVTANASLPADGLPQRYPAPAGVFDLG